jgi:hypothetical protein
MLNVELKKVALLLLLFSFTLVKAQEITIQGRAIDKSGVDCLYEAVAINQRTSLGVLAGPGGRFTIKALKTDTVLVSASGYTVKKICFRDSVNRREYKVTIRLDSLHVELKEVVVFPKKNLQEIHKEEKGLGDIRNTDVYKSANLLNPVSLLWERFNRLERSKRKVAELEDEELRRKILKDLLHLYVRYDIINMSNDEFDRFIDYLHLPDDFIKNSTDYDLVMAIKYRYEQYSKANAYYNK